MVRNLTLRDQTGSIKVALWSQAAHTEMRIGDKCTFTNLYTKQDNYLKQLTLMSSPHTKIEVTYNPHIQYVS